MQRFGKKATWNRTGMAASTIRVVLQYLKTALLWAKEQKLIPTCPKFPKIKVPQKKPQAIPAETFERLLNKAPDEQMKTYLLCGWLAGLRLSEAAMLEWEPTDRAPYLDFGRRRVILQQERGRPVGAARSGAGECLGAIAGNGA
jgi:integrase